MLPPSIQKPVSVRKVVSPKKTLSMEIEYSRTSKANTKKHQHEIGYTSCRSKFKSHFANQISDRSFPLNSSGPGGNCGSGLLVGNRPDIPTKNIVNRAIEVMSNSLKEADYTPQQPVKSVDDGDTEDESEKDRTPSDSSNSDDDNDVPTEPTSHLGNITAQLSFRKIAKKRRKAGGRSSFHHTKSSKEYLRKAQEAYQRLKINEQEQQNDKSRQQELESGRDNIENIKNPFKQIEVDASSKPSIKTKDCEIIDYGYGDPVENQSKDDHEVSQSQQTIDYGYGDGAVAQTQKLRRGGRPRRRNSVTKFSIEAANVVAARAAAERILQLKPGLTSSSRSCLTTATRRRQLQGQPQRLNAEQNLTTGRTGRTDSIQTEIERQHHQRQENYEDKRHTIVDKIAVDRLDPPQRSSCRHRGVCRDQDSVVKRSSHLQEQAESKQPKHGNSSSLLTISSTSNPHFQLTSDYFSSEPKPKNLPRRNSGRLNGTTFRFKTPARTSSTSSWLSHDNSYSTLNNDDDDDDSLASDMESLCSIRDSNYRLDTHHSNHNLNQGDIPPVLPTPPSSSPLNLASPPSDPRTRFTRGRSRSGERNLRNSLVVSWSNGSKKEKPLSRVAVDKSHVRRERRSGSIEFPILPCVGVVKSNGSASKSCMPAPVNRTPSYKGSQQRQN